MQCLVVYIGVRGRARELVIAFTPSLPKQSRRPAGMSTADRYMPRNACRPTGQSGLRPQHLKHTLQAWLDPVNLPSPAQLECSVTGRPLLFLLQAGAAWLVAKKHLAIYARSSTSSASFARDASVLPAAHHEQRYKDTVHDQNIWSCTGTRHSTCTLQTPASTVSFLEFQALSHISYRYMQPQSMSLMRFTASSSSSYRLQ